MKELTYRLFGYKPVFETKIEKRPESANSNLITNWYNNTVVGIINEEEKKGICTDYTRRSHISKTFYDTNDTNIERVYHTVTPKTIVSLKSDKNDRIYDMSLFETELKFYELEMELQKSEYEDLRNLIDSLDYLKLSEILRNVKDSSKDCGVWMEKTDNVNFEKLKACIYNNVELTFTGCETFYSCKHFWFFHIRYKNGKFEFPIKDDKYCWDGHIEYDLGSYDRKSARRYVMGGVTKRMRQYARGIEKYLNSLNIESTLQKYI